MSESIRRLLSAAEAVVRMECDRVNVDKDSEPYDPIANPGQFDERIVALAWAIEGCQEYDESLPSTGDLEELFTPIEEWEEKPDGRD